MKKADEYKLLKTFQTNPSSKEGIVAQYELVMKYAPLIKKRVSAQVPPHLVKDITQDMIDVFISEGLTGCNPDAPTFSLRGFTNTLVDRHIIRKLQASNHMPVCQQSLRLSLRAKNELQGLGVKNPTEKQINIYNKIVYKNPRQIAESTMRRCLKPWKVTSFDKDFIVDTQHNEEWGDFIINLHDVIQSEENTEEQVFSNMEKQELQNAYKKLTPEEWNVVQMRFYEGLTLKETSKKMNMDEKTGINKINNMQMKALKKIKAHIDSSNNLGK